MRDALLRSLHEAAELEHDVMCSYLYAAFGLKTGEELAAPEAVGGWTRHSIYPRLSTGVLGRGRAIIEIRRS